MGTESGIHFACVIVLHYRIFYCLGKLICINLWYVELFLKVKMSLYTDTMKVQLVLLTTLSSKKQIYNIF